MPAPTYTVIHPEVIEIISLDQSGGLSTYFVKQKIGFCIKNILYSSVYQKKYCIGIGMGVEHFQTIPIPNQHFYHEKSHCYFHVPNAEAITEFPTKASMTSC